MNCKQVMLTLLLLKWVASIALIWDAPNEDLVTIDLYLSLTYLPLIEKKKNLYMT
jgi:hypothetical protein